MNMYNNRLAVAIKHNGKILRENKDLVLLPFGSEFTVLVKNLNSRRVKFTLHIDGTDVLNGTSIIVNANSDTEIKRYIRENNSDVGNAFKFIERTDAIESGPRGIKIDDGIVRVEYWFERQVSEITTVYSRELRYVDPYYTKIGSPMYDTLARGAVFSSNESYQSMGVSGSTLQSSNSATVTASAASASNATTESIAGITVPGSKVEQKFSTVYGFQAESNSDIIVLRLAGTHAGSEVKAPVTVKTKNKCTTCSHINKAHAKFCSECGTALTLF